MPTFQIYNVIPTLPATLEPLREMTFNLWWTWEPLARRLFRHLDPDLWKSASDLDLNFVAVGLLYRHGYFRQEIDKDGAQQAISLNQNFHHLPIREVQRDGANLLISVRILDREVFAKIWQLPVGRIDLFLLDTDLTENNAEDRLITAELYGGDQEMRMRQEIMLGIGA